MRAKAIVVPVLVVMMTACINNENPNVRPSKLAGDFCDRLIASIVFGTRYFDSILGSRVGEDMYLSSLVLPGASMCYVDRYISRYDGEFVCKFFDAPKNKMNLLRNRFLELENQVRACIVAQDRFGYGEDGHGTQKVRYWQGRLQDDGDEQRMPFYDYWRNQTVNVELDCVRRGCSIVLTVDSR